jgi:hypothetical protein
MKFVVASRGHFGGVDQHGGPDFSLRLFHFVVKHLEKMALVSADCNYV